MITCLRVPSVGDRILLNQTCRDYRQFGIVWNPDFLGRDYQKN